MTGFWNLFVQLCNCLHILLSLKCFKDHNYLNKSDNNERKPLKDTACNVFVIYFQELIGHSHSYAK